MRITVLCNQQEYDEIKKKAGLIPLSVWIKSQVLNATGDRQNLRGTGGDGVDLRRTRTTERTDLRQRPRGQSTLRAIEDVTHQTLRKNLLPPGTPTLDATSTETSGRGKLNLRPFDVEIDPSMPPDEVHLRDSAGTVHKMVNVAVPPAIQYTLVQQDVARRTGHAPGCECFHCLQTLRFLAPPPPKQKEEKKPAKKGRRRV